MLISFSVSNYRSFGEEVTLNLVASNKLSDHRNHCLPIGDTGKSVLRTAVLYGANAAGKSNLVRAMDFAQSLVLENRRRGPTVERFQFAAEFDTRPSSFEFQFLILDRVFTYGFDLRPARIEAEWLTVAKGEDERVVFERDAAGITQVENTDKLFPDGETLTKLLKNQAVTPLRETQLFLNRLSELPPSAQGETLKWVVQWLTSSLVILPADYRAPDLLDRLQSDDAFRDFSATFLRQVGTGIDELRVEESEIDGPPNLSRMARPPGMTRWLRSSMTEDVDLRPNPEDPTRMLLRALLTHHLVNGRAYPLPFRDESDGTRQLLHLLPVLADQTRVFVVDELDRSLHPLMCREFIRLFSESCPGARRQLIVTTHEAHLLDQELLRRDEYWFVEKDTQHQSRLTSLVDFNIRKDLQIEKGYLQGRFGAIPMFGSFEPLRSLLECTATEDSNHAPQVSST